MVQNFTDGDMSDTIIGSVVDMGIDAVVSDGRGLGRVHGLVVLVEDALPGQRVRVRVEKVRRALAEGHMESVVEASPFERPEPCVHGAICGGCPWRLLRYNHQLHWKQRVVEDALQRIGGFTHAPVLPILASPHEWEYRNKMSFVFGTDDVGTLQLGLRLRRSHIVTNITNCRMQDALSMRVIEAVRVFAQQSGLAPRQDGVGFWRYVVIRRPRFGGCLVELIVDKHPKGRKAAVALGQVLAPSLFALGATGVVLSLRTANTDVAQGESTLYEAGQTVLEEQFERKHVHGQTPLRLQFDHRAFFQVNTAAAELLYSEAARLLALDGSPDVWDLYCGVGGIGLYLAHDAAAVRGWECSFAAVEQAQSNALLAGFDHCQFEAGDAARAFAALRYIQKQTTHNHVVVVDPPRAGLDSAVIEGLLRTSPQKIMYISCNPATLARDAKRLSTQYSLEIARPVDLFPHTPHVETAVLFVAR